MSDDEIPLAVAVAADPESDAENDIAVAAVVDDEDDDDDDDEDDGDGDGDNDNSNGDNENDDNDNTSISMGGVDMTPTKQHLHRDDIALSPISHKSSGGVSVTTPSRKRQKKESSSTGAGAAAETTPTKKGKPGRRNSRKRATPRKVNEIPSVKDLGIPFRAIKRIMKVDKDIGTVQNEAAMVATYAVELFVEKIVKESNENAKKRGRNTVKYEDLAEVRVSHKKMNFLNSLLP